MGTSSSDFGRRQQGSTRETLRAISGIPADGYDENASGRSQLRGILIGLGVVTLLFATYFISMRGFGRGLDAQWKQYVGAPVEDGYTRSPTKDVLLDQVHGACKTRSAAIPHDIGRAAAYVACLAVEKPKRLCQAGHRIHLLAAMRDYYRLTAKTDSRMAEAFKALVGAGYVPRRDLVAVVGAGDLEPVLRDIEPQRNGCAAG